LVRLERRAHDRRAHARRAARGVNEAGAISLVVLRVRA
jgi:hypothetical protein